MEISPVQSEITSAGSAKPVLMIKRQLQKSKVLARHVIKPDVRDLVQTEHKRTHDVLKGIAYATLVLVIIGLIIIYQNYIPSSDSSIPR